MIVPEGLTIIYCQNVNAIWSNLHIHAWHEWPSIPCSYHHSTLFRAHLASFGASIFAYMDKWEYLVSLVYSTQVMGRRKALVKIITWWSDFIILFYFGPPSSNLKYWIYGRYIFHMFIIFHTWPTTRDFQERLLNVYMFN